MKFSIIIVCLNSVDTIERAITSVIQQEFSELDFIIIDGGSRDGTVDILKKYSKKIDKWISEPDNGIYDAMNKGIKMAEGDVISILGSDDWYEEGIFKLVEKQFKEHECDLVCGDNYYIDKNGIKIYQDQSKYSLEDIHFGMVYGFSTIFCRKKFYEKENNFNTKYKIAADYDWVLRTIQKGAKFHYVHQPFFSFSYGGVSTTDTISCAYEARDISLKYIPEKEQKKYEKIILDKFYARLGHSSSVEQRKKILTQILGTTNGCIIWGAGEYGKLCAGWLKELGIDIKCFVDSNQMFWEKKLDEILICSPEILKYFAGILIITPSGYEREIRNKIEEFGNGQIKIIELKEIVIDIGKHMEILVCSYD